MDATSVRVHFDYIRTEERWDRVYIMDGAGKVYANYSGAFDNLWSVWVPGGTIKIRLKSDGSISEQGFVMDSLDWEYQTARHTFNSWNDGNTSASRTLRATESQTYVAFYSTEYYLNVSSQFASCGGAGWYQNGTMVYATLTAGTVDHANGTRRLFAFWSGAASGTNYVACDQICMNASKTAIANWETQYEVSFVVFPTGGGTVTPSSNTWINAGGNTLPISATATPGYQLSSWNSTTGITIANRQSSSTTATVTSPGTITATFIPEYTTSLSLAVLLTAVPLLALVFKKKHSQRTTTTKP